MLELHGGDRNRLLVGPNLWAGSASSVAGRAGTALVGSHDEVAERIRECRDIRNRRAPLLRNPHLEYAEHFGHGVLPKFASESV